MFIGSVCGAMKCLSLCKENVFPSQEVVHAGKVCVLDTGPIRKKESDIPHVDRLVGG